MKRSYIAVHDYGMGDIVARVFANEKSEVSSLLKKPTWVVWDEGDPERPRFGDERDLLESDIDNKAPWFLRQIEDQEQSAIGKGLFFFSYVKAGVDTTIAMYARTEQEVLEKFPTLTSMIGKPVPGCILKNIHYYDIDHSDQITIK